MTARRATYLPEPGAQRQPAASSRSRASRSSSPLILVAAASCLTFVLTRTAFGRHVYAVGGNAEAARRAGINVAGRHASSCFVICSTLAGDRRHPVGVHGQLGLAVDRWSATPAVRGRRGRHRRHQPVRRQGPDRSTPSSVASSSRSSTTAWPAGHRQAGIKYIVTGLVLLLAASVDALSQAGRGHRALLSADRNRGATRWHERPARQDEVRQASNLSRLARSRRVHAPGRQPGRADRRAGLNRSTIGDLTARAGRAGLVSETARAAAGGPDGRRIVVVPRQDVHVVAVDARRRPHRRRARRARRGRARARVSAGTERGGRRRAPWSRCRRASIRGARRRLPPAARFCVGVGVSVPGIVRARRPGAVRAQPRLGRRAAGRALRRGARALGALASATTPTSARSPSTCAAARSAQRRRLPLR